MLICSMLVYDELKDICDDRKVQLLYVPEKFATTLYVDGLHGWATALLEKQKEKEAEKNKSVKPAKVIVEDAIDEDDEQVG